MTAATKNVPLLEVKDLTVSFAFRGLGFDAVRDVSFTMEPGDRLGLVGESGAGKSVTGFSIINLISKPGYIKKGQVLFEGRDLTKLSNSAMRDIRGNRISMIFQDPMMTLNPVLTIGTQMVETLQAHRNISRSDAEAIALDKLRQVYIPSPEKRLDQYPHEFSGGMRQRIVIAIALLSDPALIIADEPTTALDVTIQAEIMELLLDLCETFHMGLILITHDLAVVSQVTKRIAVMYAGSIVEAGETERIVNAPAHPYTKGLLAALPGVGGARRSRLVQIPGLMPSIKNMPSGCAFHPRCEECTEVCGSAIPLLAPAPHGGFFACHLEHGCKDSRPSERELMRDRGEPA